MGVLGEIIDRVPNLIRHSESDSPPAPTITSCQSLERPRDMSPIPQRSMDSRALEAGLTCLGHTAWKGYLLPCFALYDPASSPWISRGFNGNQTSFCNSVRVWTAFLLFAKGCQIPIHSDSSPSCPLTYTVWDRKGAEVNVSLSLENLSTEFLARRQQYTEVKTRD